MGARRVTPLEPGRNGHARLNGHAGTAVNGAADPSTNGRGVASPPPLAAVPDGDGIPASRDARTGQFGPGNKFGRGNPHARKLAAMRQGLTSAISTEDMRALGQKLLAMCLNGDLAAFRLLLAYCCGLPAAAPDPDKLDLEEWALLDAMPTVGEFMRVAIDNIHPEAAFEAAKDGLPVTSAEISARMKEQGERQNALDIHSERLKRSGRRK